MSIGAFSVCRSGGSRLKADIILHVSVTEKMRGK